MAVYFIQAGEDGPVKIGTAEDVAARLSELQTGSPAPLQLLGYVSGGRADEQMLHRRFAALRMRGEWFSPAPELIDFIVAALRADAKAEQAHADALEAWDRQRIWAA